jgi:hypothetical protein
MAKRELIFKEDGQGEWSFVRGLVLVLSFIFCLLGREVGLGEQRTAPARDSGAWEYSLEVL